MGRKDASDQENSETGVKTSATGFALDVDMGDNIPQSEIVKQVEVDLKVKVSRKKDYPKKGNAGKIFAILLLLFILGCGFFVGVMFLDARGTRIMYITDFVRSVSNILVTQDIYIPYVTDLAKSNNQHDLDGRDKITVLKEPLKGEYIKNVKAGFLYVITGQIQNDYDHPRSFVKVTAKLLSKTGTQTQSAYCGNILSGIDLENLDLNEIINRLNNKKGDNKNNINIKAGKNLQFMIAFSDLLENIEMFNVRVESSSP